MAHKINWVLGLSLEKLGDYMRWREAVVAADTGDSKPLVALLRSSNPLDTVNARNLIADVLERGRLSGPLIASLRSSSTFGPDARNRLADLLARQPLKRPRGRPTTPAYRNTEIEANLADKAAHYRFHRKKGLSSNDALIAALRDAKREELRLKDDMTHCSATNEEIDALIPDAELDQLHYLVAGRRKSHQRMRKRRGEIKSKKAGS